MATTSNPANMDVPISKIDFEYLIDAAEKIYNQEIYYISYMLFKEAQELLENQGPTEYTEELQSRIREGLLHIQEDATIEVPDRYAGKTTIGKLVLFYSEYKEMYQIDWLRISSANFNQELKGEYETREYILTTSKALRTALKMLSRVARGDIPEEVFIQANKIPKEFLQDTEYDVQIGKSDIEYLIDAAEKIYIQEIFYISYMLFKEAQEMLEKFKNYQTSLIGPAQNIEDLKSRISNGLSLLTVLGTRKDPPKSYAGKTTIGKLVLFYSEYKNMYRIDWLLMEEKNHKKWGILSANYQESEGRTTLRETLLTNAKALRTALKALSLTSQERIPNEFLEDTEYDKEGSSETYNIIQFYNPAVSVPFEVKVAIESLKLGIRAFPFATDELDVLDCLRLFFKFQESSVSNQRENIVNLLSNELMRTPGERQTAIDKALKSVFDKSLGNYIEWCRYLSKDPIWNSTDENDAVEAGNDNAEAGNDNAEAGNEAVEAGNDNVEAGNDAVEAGNDNVEAGNDAVEAGNEAVEAGNDNVEAGNDAVEAGNDISNEKKILYISLYYLIWGEAANVRFLPECLCYIFHHMSREVDRYLRLNSDSLIEQVPLRPHERPFINEVIQPLYDVIAAEAKIKKEKNVPHSEWRNYDDFNEYFWSPDCFQLEWPLNKESTFFKKPSEGSTVYGKTSFVERRTFLHLYHSFHRMWIFHVMMFQALVIIAFNDEKRNSITLREILSVGPTYFLMKLIQSCCDIVLKDGAYSNTNRADVSRIRFRIICFRALCLLLTLIIYLVGMKYLQEEISSVEESIAFSACIVVLLIYACTFTWINQLEEYVVRCMDERLRDSYLMEEYVGRGMGENYIDIFWYMIFWIVTLAINFAMTYYGLIKYLVPTRDITDVSKNIPNMLAIGSLWAGAICAYIVGSHVSYNLTSAVVGYIVGRWRDRVGDIKSLGDVHKCFDSVPKAFMDHLHIPPNISESPPRNNQEDVKLNAEGFSPLWNQIVMHLREEDNISDLEKYALSMPKNSGCIDEILWPPFLLVGKVSLAIKIAAKNVPHEVMWDEIKSDVYMKYAVEECFHSVEFILSSVFDVQWREWVERIYRRIRQSIDDESLHTTFRLNNLASIIETISELTEALEQASRPLEPLETLPQEQRKIEAKRQWKNKAKNALKLKNGAEKLYNVIQRDFLGEEEAKKREFSDFKWPTDGHSELRSQIRRLHVLLNVTSADHVPRNREARRRLEFFTNSLFMSMPKPKPIREMLSFSVLTPYYDEKVLYSLDELESSNDDGVRLIDYLKNLYPDEWNNYCERLDKRYINNPEEQNLELRLWASYRGQTLARTVRGTMYYQKALLLQAYMKRSGVDDLPRTSLVYSPRTSDGDVYMDEGLDGLPSSSSVDVTSLSGSNVSIDEDTRATLNSLEERTSRGELLVQTSGIMLRDKENYEQWKEQMILMLHEEDVTSFVVGSLRDPGHGSIYSEKWKKIDKQVRKWIMSSLDESLHNYVKDIETAEQMWDVLEEIIKYQPLNELFDKVNAHVDLKFTYVVTCQKYGEQKREGKQVAADIAFLLKRNEGLRVAFVDQVNDEFYSKLVKSTNGIETEVYSIKLPGNPILGEGKPENQNHAIVFTRGNAIQTIDMNQDNYFEETLKMRNLLEEFQREHAPTILGIREHIFTGSASSLASFMSNQETGFVTLGQRVLANPLKVRMHYGYPDVFDRVFHITRGGISKASRGINISEDIYAGFNSTLRQGSVTHHEYIQVGKGRDVGFNQIAIFEGKVAGGNGEQVLSRDIYRLGQRFDFFRMLSFYYTTVGYYFSSLLMVITLYILLYGNLFMALSGTRVPHVLNDIDMAPEWFLMIVLLPAIYMLFVPFLEQGFEKAVESFLAMFFSLGSIFYAFSLGTRIHSFGRTVIHGGASYQATGRGFVLHHIKFAENYRRYSRSHFVKGMEVLFLLVVYIIYGFHSVRAFYNNLLLLGGLILSISWIVAPFLFDSSPFDLNKNSKDWKDWNDWRYCNNGPDEKRVADEEDVTIEEKSWKAWWDKELSHIRTTEGRVIETILSLRFFIFPLVVGYKLDVQRLKNSLSNCVIPWICLVGILLAYEFLLNKKPVIQFLRSKNRVATIGALAFAIVYYYAFGYMLAFTIPIITIVWGFIMGLYKKQQVIQFLQVIHQNRVATIGFLAIAYYYSAFGDKLAFIIAIITTVWGFVSFFSNNGMATIGFLAIAYYFYALGDTLAFIIAFITTLWGILSICVAWKPTLEILSLWIPVKYLAWICDIVMRALLFIISAYDDMGMLLLFFLGYVSNACEEFHLWTPVKYLAWICDTGMGALMFKIANMFSQRSIKQYLVRNLFDQNISELLHKSSADKAALYML